MPQATTSHLYWMHNVVRKLQTRDAALRRSLALLQDRTA